MGFHPHGNTTDARVLLMRPQARGPKPAELEGVRKLISQTRSEKKQGKKIINEAEKPMHRCRCEKE